MTARLSGTTNKHCAHNEVKQLDDTLCRVLQVSVAWLSCLKSMLQGPVCIGPDIQEEQLADVRSGALAADQQLASLRVAHMAAEADLHALRLCAGPASPHATPTTRLYAALQEQQT